ncbi:MAG: hypothetical protein AAF998_10520 [Bacteroidota bacterium]
MITESVRLGKINAGRKHHLIGILHNEVGFGWKSVMEYLKKVDRKPEALIKAVDMSERLDNKQKGRLKRCIRGISKAYQDRQQINRNLGFDPLK